MGYLLLYGLIFIFIILFVIGLALFFFGVVFTKKKIKNIGLVIGLIPIGFIGIIAFIENGSSILSLGIVIALALILYGQYSQNKRLKKKGTVLGVIIAGIYIGSFILHIGIDYFNKKRDPRPKNITGIYHAQKNSSDTLKNKSSYTYILKLNTDSTFTLENGVNIGTCASGRYIRSNDRLWFNCENKSSSMGYIMPKSLESTIKWQLVNADQSKFIYFKKVKGIQGKKQIKNTSRMKNEH